MEKNDVLLAYTSKHLKELPEALRTLLTDVKDKKLNFYKSVTIVTTMGQMEVKDTTLEEMWTLLNSCLDMITFFKNTYKKCWLFKFSEILLQFQDRSYDNHWKRINYQLL